MVTWKTTFLYQHGVFHFHVSESEGKDTNAWQGFLGLLTMGGLHQMEQWFPLKGRFQGIPMEFLFYLY